MAVVVDAALRVSAADTALTSRGAAVAAGPADGANTTMYCPDSGGPSAGVGAAARLSSIIIEEEPAVLVVLLLGVSACAFRCACRWEGAVASAGGIVLLIVGLKIILALV